MAPRRSKKVVSVTKKKKVTEETIEVTVTDGKPNVITETVTQDTQEETQDQETQEEETQDEETQEEETQVQDTQEEETQDLMFSSPVTTVEIPINFGDDRSPKQPETPASQSEGKKKHGEEEATVKETNKVDKKHAKKKKRKSGDVAGDEYKRYVYKVMKEVHPELGITSKAMSVINMFMGDMFKRIAEEASRLNDQTKRRTLSSREVEAAVRLVLPGELSRHAVAEGSKAMSNYVAYNAKKR
ncbi:unnamed protein product [Cochlearia groenlandica]